MPLSQQQLETHLWKAADILRGRIERDVPRWVLVEPGAEIEVIGTLDRVAASVRARVSERPTDIPFDGTAADVLEAALTAAEQHQETAETPSP